MTKAIEEARAIALKPANLMRAIEYALRHSPVVETTFSEEGDFDVEIHEPASLEAFATAFINEVAPGIIATALSAASALTAGEREPLGVRCTGCGSSWDDERLAKERLNNPALRSCCPERDPQLVYYSPPALELEALRKERDEAIVYMRNLLRTFVSEHFPDRDGWKPLDDLVGMLTQIDNASTIAREYKARLAEALKALEDARAAILEADPNILTCTLWMPGRISPNETVSDYLDAAALRVRDGGQADG